MGIMVMVMARAKDKLLEDFVPGSGTVFSNRFAQMLDRLVEILLISAVGFMPFAFGGVQAWSEEVFVLLSGGMVFCFLLRQAIFPEIEFTVSWSYLPVFLFLLWVFFSVVPLPANFISAISANTAALKAELLYGSSEAYSRLGKTTLSFYANETKALLRVMAGVCGVFFVVVNVFKTGESIKRLLRSIVFIGVATALLAMAQNVLGNNKIYWFVEVPGKANSGPFINHSHFGQFMNLSVGAGIGLLLVKLFEDFFEKRSGPAEVFEYFDSRRAMGFWILIVSISLCVAAMFVSLTRGGMVSMLLALSVTVLLVSVRKSFRASGWVVLVVALAALLCILYTGFDTVYGRFASFTELDSYTTRVQLVKDLFEPVRKFSVFGTGLGSHSVVYPMFQSINTALEFSHAENEYVQLAEETGLVGLGLMLFFVVLVVLSFFRAIRHKDRALNMVSYGLGFGIVAVLVHSLSDFGQRLPANATLTAVFCGLLIVLGHKNRLGNRPLGSLFFRRVLRSALLVFFVLFFGWSLAGADRARLAEEYWQRADNLKSRFIFDIDNGSDADLVKLIECASYSVEKEPGNVEYRQWLNIYRWWRVRRFSDRQTGAISNDGLDEVYRIVDDLKDARFTAPTYGPIYCLLGQIQKYVLYEPAGEDNINRGAMLEPNDELTMFVAGELDLRNGDFDRSFEKFNKSVSLGGIFFERIIELYIDQAGRGELAVRLAGDDVYRLRAVLRKLESRGSCDELADRCRMHLLSVMEGRSSRGLAEPREFAELAVYYGREGHLEKAIEYYKRALFGDYGKVYWRLALAKLLAQAGDVSEAMNQCRICLKMNPGFASAKDLLGELSLRPETIKNSPKTSEELPLRY